MASVEVHVHEHIDLGKLKQFIVETQHHAIQLLKEFFMATVQELRQDIADTKGLVVQLIDLVKADDALVADLKAQVTALGAQHITDTAALAAFQSDVDAAFADAEDLKNTARAGVPGVPPVGGSPLLPSYPDVTQFNTAVAAYTGPEQVTLDGAEVKAGTTPAMAYTTNGDGSVSTGAPL